MKNEQLKKNCAKAALAYIKNDMVIGLGGGSTIAYLIDHIEETKNLNVKVVTPSWKTKLLCLEKGLDVLHTCMIDYVDIAFDGCDEVDENLNALKSGGGIHTQEKIIANMAKEYVLLIDKSKFVPKLTFKHPVVLEILESSLRYILKKMIDLGGKPVVRESPIKDGYTISDNGNILVDVYFNNVRNIHKLEKEIKQICGVIETSLFTNIVTKAIVVSAEGLEIVSS